MKMRITALLISALLAAGPAAASEKVTFVEARPIKDVASVAIAPSKAYILFRADEPTPVYLSKLPTAEDDAAYAKLRAEAMAKAQEKYVRQLAAYQREQASPPAAGLTPLEKPVAPTEGTLKLTPYAQMAGVAMGPLNRFVKSSDGISTYLEEVTPGSYRIYGLVDPVLGVGSCFCMGSVKFEAKAGQVTDIGVLLVHAAPRESRPADDSSAPQISMTFFTPAPAAMLLDPRLAGLPVQLAKFQPVGKLPNYFGVTIGRMPEMPGVMRYERDRIVDLTAGQ